MSKKVTVKSNYQTVDAAEEVVGSVSNMIQSIADESSKKFNREISIDFKVKIK